jgi:hypothetical protein
MSSRKFIWKIKQLRFYAKFPYLKIRKNSQDFAKKLHFHKNYCRDFRPVLPYSLRTKSVQKRAKAYIKAFSAYTFKRTTRTTRTFYKKTSIKIVSIFFSKKNVLKLIIINEITFLHDNINKINIKKSLKLG